MSQRTRFLIGAGVGGSVGAMGGISLSPNKESKGLNALIFGIGGALLGGTVSLLMDPKTDVGESSSSLKEKEKEKELGAPHTTDTSGTLGSLIQTGGELPPYLKERFKPALIEEFMERDTLGEDGSLHEPHKVYRIKRQAELFPGSIKPQPDKKPALKTQLKKREKAK